MEKIGIVIVSYNPTNIEELINNIKECRKQTDLVVVVDNSDQNDKSESLRYRLTDDVYFICLGDNQGIAKAQNIGIKYCIQNGCKYILELDQDSVIPENFLNNLYTSFYRIQKSGIKIAGIAPVIVDRQTGKYYYEKPGDKIIEVDKAISSGFMISSEAFKLVGSKDESLFIDFVDWEWNWRAKTKGYKTFINTNIIINHQMGKAYKNFYFFRIIKCDPIRYYYQYRNALIMISRDYTPLIWKIRRLFTLMVQPIILMIFYDNKISNLKYFFLGVKNFIRNKNGKIK